MGVALRACLACDILRVLRTWHARFPSDIAHSRALFAIWPLIRNYCKNDFLRLFLWERQTFTRNYACLKNAGGEFFVLKGKLYCADASWGRLGDLLLADGGGTEAALDVPTPTLGGCKPARSSTIVMHRLTTLPEADDDTQVIYNWLLPSWTKRSRHSAKTT